MSKLTDFLMKHRAHLGIGATAGIGAGLGSMASTAYQVHRAKKEAKEFITERIPSHLLEHGGKYAAGIGLLGGAGAIAKNFMDSDSYEDVLNKFRGKK